MVYQALLRSWKTPCDADLSNNIYSTDGSMVERLQDIEQQTCRCLVGRRRQQVVLGGRPVHRRLRLRRLRLGSRVVAGNACLQLCLQRRQLSLRRRPQSKAQKLLCSSPFAALRMDQDMG